MTFIPLDDFMIYYEDSERVRDHCLAFLKELKRMDTTCDICDKDRSPDFQLICRPCLAEMRFQIVSNYLTAVENRLAGAYYEHTGEELWEAMCDEKERMKELANAEKN